jgi:hypothetical protein
MLGAGVVKCFLKKTQEKKRGEPPRTAIYILPQPLYARGYEKQALYSAGAAGGVIGSFFLRQERPRKI